MNWSGGGVWFMVVKPRLTPGAPESLFGLRIEDRMECLIQYIHTHYKE